MEYFWDIYSRSLVRTATLSLECSSSILYRDSIWLLLFDFSPSYFYKLWNRFSCDLISFSACCNLKVSSWIDFSCFSWSFFCFSSSPFSWLITFSSSWIFVLCSFILSFAADSFDYRLFAFLFAAYWLSAIYLFLESRAFLPFFCSSRKVYSKLAYFLVRVWKSALNTSS